MKDYNRFTREQVKEARPDFNEPEVSMFFDQRHRDKVGGGCALCDSIQRRLEEKYPQADRERVYASLVEEEVTRTTGIPADAANIVDFERPLFSDERKKDGGKPRLDLVPWDCICCLESGLPDSSYDSSNCNDGTPNLTPAAAFDDLVSFF